MSIVYANIGSNLGKKKELIESALEKISAQFGICCISSYIESEPWGFESSNRFLNLGVSFKTEFEPEEVLLILQAIEREISTVTHRDQFGRYKDREIDIDIMAIDDIRLSTDILKLPHPRLPEREFFYKPMKELSPDWMFPNTFHVR